MEDGQSCELTSSCLVVEAAEAASSVSTAQVHSRNQPTSTSELPQQHGKFPKIPSEAGSLKKHAEE